MSLSPNYRTIGYALKNCMNCGKIVRIEFDGEREVECECGNIVKLEEEEMSKAHPNYDEEVYEDLKDIEEEMIEKEGK